MNAARRTKQESSSPVTDGASADVEPVSWIRLLAICGVLILVMLGVGYDLWTRWGPTITSQREYQLRPEYIEITPPPPWIQANVHAEVVRDGGLVGLSILEHQLTVKVAQAFAMHSWVEQVTHVSKQNHPARVTVELKYRRPVAMVEVVVDQQPGLLPVDAHGILLPPQDFSMEQTRDYLRIAVPHAVPSSPVGSPWGQTEVHEAARIAAMFREHWRACGLYRIQLVPAGSADSTQIHPVFELHSRSGAAVIWGWAPDSDDEDEMRNALAKVAKILEYVQAHGSLEDASPGTHLDLREHVPPGARTAERSR